MKEDYLSRSKTRNAKDFLNSNKLSTHAGGIDLCEHFRASKFKNFMNVNLRYFVLIFCSFDHQYNSSPSS